MTEAAAPGVQPFAGLRVIDLSRVLAGPLCGQMLADAGAEVIKVEAPSGDENRKWGPHAPSGESCNFMSVNRGKRGITLNLKSQEGQALLHTLLADADVLLMSFLPKAYAQLGVEPEELRKKFPKLVIACITAFGQKGAMANAPGYDSLSQAFTGIMSITGERDGMPVRSGVSFIDMTTGIYAYSGVLTALQARHVTGEGTIVSVSLLETGISLLGYHAVGWLQTQTMPRRDGSGLWHLVPYQAFRCKDGDIQTGALNDQAWERLCVAVDAPDLWEDVALRTSVGRVEQRDRVIDRLKALFLLRTVDEWKQVLDLHGIAVSELHTIDQSLQHSQTLANAMVVELERADGEKLKLLGAPFKLHGTRAHSEQAPPRLGEHTDEVLSSFAGLDAARIQALRAQGVI